ncbi:hypothetical protein Ddc_14028 [Ditylenchus destructor]|nr:hypothetical protein Ddc_14028 [Ditylenchus destructor]
MIVVLAFMAFSLCSAKSVGLSSLTNLAQVSAQSDETVACQFCNDFVKGCDEHGVKPEYNTSEKMARGLQEICPQVPRGSPDAAFCKAIKGNYRVFTDAYFQHREHPEVDPCKVAGVCREKFVGFKNLASLSKVFALSDEASVCEICESLVALLDKGVPEPGLTPEKMAKYMEEQCPQEPSGSPLAQLCKALEGKYLVFTKAYFRHREHPEVEPCKEAQVC